MNKDKILKILEKIIIFLVTLIMISVLANNYLRVSEGAINDGLRMAQIVLAIAIIILTLIMAVLTKNKRLFFVLIGFYILTGVLFYIFKSANRI
ncbi:MAG: hypothetical protein QP753_01230 [Peptoniphilus harei]|uniref:Uncharacterized protein n=1 Tax=Peptoniphilus harei ACS-146-V-Sch2b TaxID=908338 RepID=E4KWT1_9FIRM|nr:hypothetical protein [Peptoniphilus harei]EFR33601.1 conserved hypothetical protein [Peptoniphilus harei ACS-146-V-Sch2b]MDK7754643.1 hypothetical protein [Peptoniphilus harei]MDK7760449.1 hypothetical protein [Peptoniphilus harei]MDK8270239.1 hypothetical protein [Peptoniphilus harei]MDK8338699.1 hypothetical protein [Peptoniphilus harei]